MLSQITVKVCDKSNQLVVDSRLIAEAMGIKHNTFLKTIRKYKSQVEQAFEHLGFEVQDVAIGNNATRQDIVCYLLTENQATFLMTLSRNTPQVIQCKINLVKAFSDAKELLKSVRTQPQPVKAPAKVINPQYLPGRKAALDKFKEHGAKGWMYGAVESYNNALVGIPNGGRTEVDELQAYKLIANYYAMRDDLESRQIGFARHPKHLVNVCRKSMRHGVYAITGANSVPLQLKPASERQ